MSNLSKKLERGERLTIDETYQMAAQAWIREQRGQSLRYKTPLSRGWLRLAQWMEEDDRRLAELAAS